MVQFDLSIPLEFGCVGMPGNDVNALATVNNVLIIFWSERCAVMLCGAILILPQR